MVPLHDWPALHLHMSGAMAHRSGKDFESHCGPQQGLIITEPPEMSTEGVISKFMIIGLRGRTAHTNERVGRMLRCGVRRTGQWADVKLGNAQLVGAAGVVVNCAAKGHGQQSEGGEQQGRAVGEHLWSGFKERGEED